VTLSRRGFLQGTAVATAGLAISFYVPTGAKAQPKPKAAPPPPPNAFVRIGSDDSVTVLLAHSEMGQGIWTGLAMLIAEELECDWSKVRCEHAPAAIIYGHPLMGIQMTGGSASQHGEFERYRTVGATAKEMLVRAAATKLKTKPTALKVVNGVISNGKQSVRFGEVAEDAMKLQPAAKVTLKKPADWKIIGKPTKRLDSPAKITGTATFGMDIQFEGLRVAMIARPPGFGWKRGTVDSSAALKISGVEQVVTVDAGVAVVATNTWAAKVGRDALKVDWQVPESPADTERFLTEYRELAQKPGAVVVADGKIDDAFAKGKIVEAEYVVPFLAHAPMEPLNCAVKITGDEVEIWTGTQMQTLDQMTAAKLAKTSPDKVKINTTFLGGGFGRRANPAADFVAEAVMVAQAAKVPIKTVWTREDDIRGGWYRPMFLHRVRAAVNGDGMPTAWDHTVVGQSIMEGGPFAMMIKNGVDETSVEGIAESPYLSAIKTKRVTLHSPKSAVTVLWWRSVGNTHTAFAMECMIDELAHAAGKDPLAYRLALLKGHKRHIDALSKVAEEAGWGKAAPAGRARGLAIHESFGSIVAECAEVSIDKRGGREFIRVHEVHVAADCGQAVNPLAVDAQLHGSVAYGMSAAMHGKLTLKDGRVQESNFHDYPVLRMAEMPVVKTYIINSGAKMGGIGEPATAPIAPAIANAVFALTKQRLRTLPFELGGGK
jgi:isoquinoline 1-oxidoreductase beta subunit